MELVRGKAAKVRHTLQMDRGAGDRHSHVTTTHICLLQLQERTVSLHARHPLIVNEGDQLVVAGRSDRQGLLRDITEVFSKDKINVIGVQTETQRGVAKMQFTAEVGSGEQLRGALSHLLEINGVFEVRRR